MAAAQASALADDVARMSFSRRFDLDQLPLARAGSASRRLQVDAAILIAGTKTASLQNQSPTWGMGIRLNPASGTTMKSGEPDPGPPGVGVGVGVGVGPGVGVGVDEDDPEIV
jgi:hypothetical protein